MLRSFRSASLFVGFLCIISEGFAQTLPGEPTIGDVMRGQLAGVIESQQQLAAAKGEAKIKYDAARERFFTTDPKSPAHKEAEREFAQLLHAKDNLYLGMVINVGVEHGLAHASGMGAISGGGDLLDNGIPKAALQAFTNWATGVRASLGATTDNQLLMVTDEVALKKALIENEPAYLLYKKQRDKAEFQLWAIAHPRENQKAGNLPMFKQRTVHVYEADANSAYPNSPEGARLRTTLFSQDNPQLLLFCTYGPGLTAIGEDAFVTYKFWHPRPPDNIKELLAMDTANSLQWLGDVGVDSCPATDGDALRTRQAAMKASQTPEYEAMRAAYRKQKSDDSQNYAAIRDRVRSDCEKLGQRIVNSDTGISRELSYRWRVSAFTTACSMDERNHTATAVPLTIDANEWCKYFKINVDSFAGATSNAELAADVQRNYEAYCNGSGDIVTGKALPTVSGAAAATVSPSTNSSPAASPTQSPTLAQSDDPRVRMCLARQQNLSQLRENASGFRERMALSSMESAFKRDCAAILSNQ